MGEIIMITGGIKSGKSSFALACGEQGTQERAFVATACAFDEEMQRKIHLHRQERADRWKTFEEPRDIVELITKISSVFDVVLVDCLTLWVSNMLTMYGMIPEDIEQESTRLLDAAKSASARIILVTNEVGLGVIPTDPLARSYQNLLGMLNKQAAQAASSLYFLLAGVPLKMK